MDNVELITANCDCCGKEHTYKKRFYKIEACETDKYGLFTVNEETKAFCFDCIEKIKKSGYTICDWCDNKYPCLVPQDSLVSFQFETKSKITNAVICKDVQENELKKQELLNIFLKGDIPVCEMDLGMYVDFDTEQGMLSRCSTEIIDFIEKYGEDPFLETTDEVIRYLLDNLPDNRRVCTILRFEMYCAMIVNNGIKSVISLVKNCLTCDIEGNGVCGEDVNSARARDFIDFIEGSYSICFEEDNILHKFKLKHNGINITDWYLVSDDEQFSYKLYGNK